MKISKQHLKKGSKKRSGKKVNPKYITIHSTGNSRSTAQNERDWLTNPSNKSYTGWHYVVGDKIIIEAIPPSERAWHVGDGKNGKGNNRSIGIEMVETGNRDRVIKNTIKLTKYLQNKFNIKDDNVVRHYDWIGKNCPRIFNKSGKWEGWVYFKTLLKKEGISMSDKEVRKIVKNECKKVEKEIKSYVDSEIEKAKIDLVGYGTEVSKWFRDEWKKGIDLDITDGRRPKGYATREEVVSLILRSLDKIDK